MWKSPKADVAIKYGCVKHNSKLTIEFIKLQHPDKGRRHIRYFKTEIERDTFLVQSNIKYAQEGVCVQLSKNILIQKGIRYDPNGNFDKLNLPFLPEKKVDTLYQTFLYS